MGKSLQGKELGRGITQRSSGLYNARAAINGVQISVYDTNLKALKEKFEKEKAKVTLGEYVVNSNITLDEWFLNKWFPMYKQGKLKDDLSCYNYIRRYQNTFGKYLGSEKMTSITELQVQGIANILTDKRRTKHYSSKFVKESLSSIRECFAAAKNNNIIRSNPVFNVIISDDEEKERLVLTAEQQQNFLEVASDRYYAEVYRILLSTGLRAGELAGLRWEDIDFKNKEIHVRHSLQSAYFNGKKVMRLTTPKTNNGKRSIPMFGGVEDDLKSWKAKQELSMKNLGDRWRLPTDLKGLVFTSSFGSPLTRYVLSIDIKKIVDIINQKEVYYAKLEGREPNEFPAIHPHTFRHTFCTNALTVKNLDPVFVMKVMGHASFQTTLSYTHQLDNVTKRQVELAGSFIA